MKPENSRELKPEKNNAEEETASWSTPALVWKEGRVLVREMR